MKRQQQVVLKWRKERHGTSYRRKRVRRLLEIEERVEEQLECLVTLCSVLRANTKKKHVPRLHRHVYDSGSTGNMFLSHEPTGSQDTIIRVNSYRPLASCYFESGSVFEPKRNIPR